MHPMLNIAVKAARRAGQIINRASLELDTVEVTTKQSRDFVTDIDRAAEVAIIEIIKNHYPHHGILAEESGQADANAEYQWIIDPLDGTTNFIHGIPHYAVSIALAHRKVLTQAVVFDPNRNEMFTASRGVGAYLNDRRMRVTTEDDLERSVIGTGFPFRAQTDYSRYFPIFHELTEQAAGIRRPGAAALDLAWVGCGRFDGFFEMGLKPWDAAAGALLIMEAGGLVSDWSGEQDYLSNGDMLAATPKIYTQLLRRTRKANSATAATPPI